MQYKYDNHGVPRPVVADKDKPKSALRPHSGNRYNYDEWRIKIALYIATHGPASVNALSKKIEDNAPSYPTIKAILTNHPWFERKSKRWGLSPAGWIHIKENVTSDI